MRTALLALSLIAFAACTKSQVPADPAEQARAAVAQAEALYGSSWEAGHAWRAPKALIDDARAALEAGDYETAASNADRATAMAEASLAQAEAESTAWRNRFPFSS
jgi:hypothetical protein